MAAPVQFWFEFASTYSYLSAMRIEQLAADKGVSIDWQPFLLGPIFAEQGWNTSPFTIYPAKGRYMWRDMERLCAARALPFQRPDPFPQNSLTAARLAVAITSQDQRAAFTRAVYMAEFGEGHDISAASTLTDCLAAAGLAADFIESSQDPKVKAALFEQSSRAKDLDLFGAPSFVVGDEVFWGDDRLLDAINHALAI